MRRAGRSVSPRRWWKRPADRKTGSGLFGRIKTEQGRIDLKKHGLFGIVTAARALAICHHVVERATPARLMALKAMDLGGDSDLEALARGAGDVPAFHSGAADRGYRAGPAREQCRAVKSLSARDRERLRAALAAVKPVDELTRDLLFKD